MAGFVFIVNALPTDVAASRGNVTRPVCRATRVPAFSKASLASRLPSLFHGRRMVFEWRQEPQLPRDVVCVATQPVPTPGQQGPRKSKEVFQREIAQLDEQILTIRRVLDYFEEKGMDAQRFREGYRVAQAKREKLIRQLESAPEVTASGEIGFVPRSPSPRPSSPVARSMRSPSPMPPPAAYSRSPSPRPFVGSSPRPISPKPATPASDVVAASASPAVASPSPVTLQSSTPEPWPVAPLTAEISSQLVTASSPVPPSPVQSTSLVEDVIKVSSPVPSYASTPEPWPVSPFSEDEIASPASAQSATPAPVSSPAVRMVQIGSPVRSPSPVSPPPSPFAPNVFAVRSTPPPVAVSPLSSSPAAASPVPVADNAGSPDATKRISVLREEVRALENRIYLMKKEEDYANERGLDASRFILGQQAAVERRDLLLAEMNTLIVASVSASPVAAVSPTPIPAVTAVSPAEGKSPQLIRQEILAIEDRIDLLQEEIENAEAVQENSAKLIIMQEQAVQRKEALIDELRAAAVVAQTPSQTPASKSPVAVAAEEIPIGARKELFSSNPVVIKNEIKQVELRIDLIRREMSYYEQKGMDKAHFEEGLASVQAYLADLVQQLERVEHQPSEEVITPGLSAMSPKPASPAPSPARSKSASPPRPRTLSGKSIGTLETELSMLARRQDLITKEVAYYESHEMDASRLKRGLVTLDLARQEFEAEVAWLKWAETAQR